MQVEAAGEGDADQAGSEQVLMFSWGFSKHQLLDLQHRCGIVSERIEVDGQSQAANILLDR